MCGSAARRGSAPDPAGAPPPGPRFGGSAPVPPPGLRPGPRSSNAGRARCWSSNVGRAGWWGPVLEPPGALGAGPCGPRTRDGVLGLGPRTPDRPEWRAPNSQTPEGFWALAHERRAAGVAGPGPQTPDRPGAGPRPSDAGRAGPRTRTPDPPGAGPRALGGRTGRALGPGPPPPDGLRAGLDPRTRDGVLGRCPRTPDRPGAGPRGPRTPDRPGAGPRSSHARRAGCWASPLECGPGAGPRPTNAGRLGTGPRPSDAGRAGSLVVSRACAAVWRPVGRCGGARPSGLPCGPGRSPGGRFG